MGKVQGEFRTSVRSMTTTNDLSGDSGQGQTSQDR